MDKKKGAQKAAVLVDLAKTTNNLKDKSMYLKSVMFKEYFFDSNYVGNVLLDNMNRGVYQKWEFVGTDTPGVYYIRNAQTQFVLSSNSKGDIFTDILTYASTQQWIVYPHTENSVIRNFSNEFVLDTGKMMSIFSTVFDEKVEPKQGCLWKITGGRGDPKK